jgi:predicted nucleic acid-binding Zn ribbon protein
LRGYEAARVSEAGASVCANCGAPLAGQYCSRCGQEILDAHKLTVRHSVFVTAVQLLGALIAVWRL